MKYICTKCGTIFDSLYLDITPDSDNPEIDFSCPIDKCRFYGGILIPLDDLCVGHVNLAKSKGYKTHCSCSSHPNESSNCYITLSLPKHKYSNKHTMINSLKKWMAKYKDTPEVDIKLDDDCRCIFSCDEDDEYKDRFVIYISIMHHIKDSYNSEIYDIYRINSMMNEIIDKLPDYSNN